MATFSLTLEFEAQESVLDLVRHSEALRRVMMRGAAKGAIAELEKVVGGTVQLDVVPPATRLDS